MGMPRRKVVRLVLGATVLAVAAGIVTLLALRLGDSRAIDTWIGRQIVGIVGGYIEPRIEFGSLRYTAPYRVDLQDVTLTARDGTKVADARALTVELAEVPSAGKPIRIRTIVLDGAAVNLLESQDGGFKGFVPFVRAAPGKESEQTVDKDLRLSNVLRLDRVELRECSINYTPADGSPPMMLAGISLGLDVAADAQSGPGSYRIDTSFGRLPQLTVETHGVLNLDTLVAQFDKAELRVQVGPQTMQGLPPPVQAFLQKYDAQGSLTVALSGRLPFLKAMDGDLTAEINLDAFRFSSGDMTLPIDEAEAALTLKEGTVTLERTTVSTLGGAVHANGVARLSRPGQPAELSWNIEHVDLQAMLRHVEAGSPPRMAGIVDGTGLIRTDLENPQAALAGDGEVKVRQGRLLFLPGFEAVAESLNMAGRLLSSSELAHNAEAKFTLSEKGLTITHSTVETELIAARATGLLGIDRTIDLRVNAGPLEKMQSLLGGAGRLLGRLTDAIVTYHVHGTFDAPEVSVVPLGIGG